jgi:hypothetical protein
VGYLPLNLRPCSEHLAPHQPAAPGLEAFFCHVGLLLENLSPAWGVRGRAKEAPHATMAVHSTLIELTGFSVIFLDLSGKAVISSNSPLPPRSPVED